MSVLKRSLFWAAFYLSIIFFLGQLDRADRPVINFASYFYLLIFVVVPCVVLIPMFYRAPLAISMIFWASIYFALSRILDRSLSAGEGVEIVILEVFLLELGVWVSYQLAQDISHSESLLDAMAESTFPNSAIPVDKAYERISNEITRSRRYHRPLSILVIRTMPEDKTLLRELVKNFQRDLLGRFSSARMGQVIGERIRQTDILLRERLGLFVVLCPETDGESAKVLGSRIQEALEQATGINVVWGSASFPDEALTFDDLLLTARRRLTDNKEIQAQDGSG